MNDIGRMYVLETTKYLINKVLNVVVCKLVFGVNNLVKIGFHKWQYHVSVFKYPLCFEVIIL